MSKLGVSLGEKPLLQHLCRGGSVRDDVGSALVREFIEKMVNNPTISATTAHHNFTSGDLAALYAGVVDSMMPTPWMNAGGPMLAATAFLMEPHRLEAVLQETQRKLSYLELPSDQRLTLAVSVMSREASLLKITHDHAFGPANIKRYVAGDKSGCLGVVMLPLLLALALLFLR